MKVGTVSKVMLGGNADVSTKSGIIIDADVILGKAEGRTKDLKGLVLSNKVMFGKSVSRAKMATVSGVAPLVLADAISANVVELIAFGGTEQRNLPIGYTALEYIESTGTQYINLGYKGNGNTKVEVKFKYHTATSASGSGRVFGSRNAAAVDAFAIGSASGTASTNSTVAFFFGNQSYLVTDKAVVLDEWLGVIFDKTTHSINGVDYGDQYNDETFETPQNLKLFGFDNSGTMGVGYVDVAYCKLWDNGVLVRDLVPAKNSSNVIGMYDLVSGQFLTNQGTDVFVAGPVAIPTPDTPMGIVSNNGVLKYSANMANVNAQTALIGYYISATGVVTADANNWMYQDYIPVSPNTTYTITMSSPVYFVSISEYSTASDSGFVIRKAGSTGTNTSLTITTGATTNFIRFGTNIDRTEITLEEVLAINWQLNKGNSMPYTPYVAGGIYTDGTVETIRVSGNLVEFNETRIDINTWASADKTKGFEVCADVYGKNVGDSLFSNGNCFGVFVPCKKGQSVSIDFFDYAPFYSRCYYCEVTADRKVNTTPAAYASSTSLTQKTFTLTQDDSVGFVMEWYIASTQIRNYTKENYTVVAGTTPPTQYIPFNICTATAEMLLKVGDYADQHEIIDGTVTRRVGVKVLDGTESFSSGQASGVQCISIPKTAWGISSDTLPENSLDVICTHYKAVNGSDWAQSKLNTIKVGSGYLFFNTEYVQNSTSFKAYLANQYAAGTPVIVIYPLPTATTETVTGQPMTTTQGTNIAEITQASLDGLELSVTYMAGVDATVEEIEDAQLSPDVDVTIE